MSIYKKVGTSTTPEVHFDGKSGNFSITGKSFWEDVEKFYFPLTQWLKDTYLVAPAERTRLTIQLDYLNTSTSKQLFDVFALLQSLTEEDKEVEIVWRFHEDDEDLEEQGKDYQSMLSIAFRLEPYSD